MLGFLSIDIEKLYQQEYIIYFVKNRFIVVDLYYNYIYICIKILYCLQNGIDKCREVEEMERKKKELKFGSIFSRRVGEEMESLYKCFRVE